MTRRSKKSEMLEVRLSLQDKDALRAKAASEGLTVSAAVRRLIADYLRQPESAVSSPTHRITPMTLIKHPLKTFAAIGTLIGAAFILTPFAYAEPLRLVVETEHMSAVTETLDNGEETRGIRTRRYNTEVEIDSGESLCFDLISSQACDPDNLAADSETINLKATQTDRGIYIEMRVMSGSVVVATPTLIVGVGETAQFLTGSESGAGLSLKIEALDG